MMIVMIGGGSTRGFHLRISSSARLLIDVDSGGSGRLRQKRLYELFETSLCRVADDSGFSYYLAAYFPEADLRLLENGIICTNWPTDVYKEYVLAGHFGKGEFVSHARRTILPLFGNDVLFPKRLPGGSEALRTAFEARGLHSTLAFSLCDHEDQRYVFFFSRPHDEEWEPDTPRVLFETMKLIEGLSPRPTETLGNHLSMREIECLGWAAAGKSSFETATILKISAHTVNGYMKSAMRKMDVVNRMQAVAKACRLGII
ncbi:helix-turn-helix transcriptional regulator [Rhizobium sp. Rhizsp82]|uniref:helix-turn-helix transcriptional regulator n=1 Tax=Rhizobium sp. Rhizsp82 TaxID=3243057 RepID=UPI0039B514A0